MHRRQFIALAGALAGVGQLACGKRIESNIIRVSAHPFFSMSGLYLAEELGYFTKLGLRIRIERFASAAQAIPLAAGGKLDVLFSGSSPSLVNAIARGSHLRIVAGREIAAPDCSDLSTVFGRRDVFPGGLQDIRLLKGKRVATDLTIGMGRFGADMVLASAGLTANDLGILDMKRSELIIALLSGKVDAIILSDSAMRFAKMPDQIVRGISLANALPNLQVSFVIFGSRLLNGDPEAGAKFLCAYLRGASEYLAGKTPGFHDALATSSGIDPEVARKACRDSFVPDGRIDLPSLERFIQWSRAAGFCPLPVQAEQLVDARFLQKQAAYGGVFHP